jgi:hypothetical protein
VSRDPVAREALERVEAIHERLSRRVHQHAVLGVRRAGRLDRLE